MFPILRIFLIGLVALVPTEDEHGNQGMFAIFQEARGEAHHLHFPVVIFECGNLPGGVCSANPSIPGLLVNNNILNKSDSSIRRFQARLLQGEHITINNGVGGEVVFAGGRQTRWYQRVIGAVPRGRQAAQDLSWVPYMPAISPSAGVIDEEIIGDNPDPLEIAGVLRLLGTEARVSVFGFADSLTAIHSFTFKKEETPISIWDEKQALADIVMIEVPLGAAEAQLVLTRMNDDNRTEEVRLQPMPGERTIDIVLGNLPPRLPDLSMQEVSADHFILYYELAKNKDSSIQIPFKGSRKVASSRIESVHRPRIIAFVEERRNGSEGPIASSNRPICTQVIFEEQ